MAKDADRAHTEMHRDPQKEGSQLGDVDVAFLLQSTRCRFSVQTGKATQSSSGSSIVVPHHLWNALNRAAVAASTIVLGFCVFAGIFCSAE